MTVTAVPIVIPRAVKRYHYLIVIKTKFSLISRSHFML